MDGWSERGRPVVREALDNVWEVIDREIQNGTLVPSSSQRGRLINTRKNSRKGPWTIAKPRSS